MTALHGALLALTAVGLAAAEGQELWRLERDGAPLPLEVAISLPAGGDHAVWLDVEQAPQGYTREVLWPEAAKAQHAHTGQAVLPPGDHAFTITDRWNREREGRWTLVVRSRPDPDGGEADGPQRTRPAGEVGDGVVLWPQGDADWFTLESPGPGYWYCRHPDQPRGFTPWTAFIDPTGEHLGTNQARVAAAGTVRAQVRDRWGNFGSLEPIATEFRFVAESDPSEPNDSRETARPVAANRVIETAIALPGDRDWLRLEVTDAVYLEVEQLDQLPGFTPWHSVTDADGNRLGRNHVRVDLPGTIYVGIADRWGNFQRSEPFRLRVATTPVDDYLEPNDEPVQAAPVETQRWFQAAIAPAGDRDHWLIESPAPGIVVPRVVDGPDNLRWAVIDPSSGEADDRWPLRVGAGEAVIRLTTRWNQSPGYTPFRLRLDWFPADDAYEPNDEEPATVALGEAVRVRLPTGDDIDRFRIICEEPGLLHLFPLGTPPLNLAFSHGAEASAISGPELVIPVDRPGPVTFALRGADGAWATAPVTFSSAMIAPRDPGEPNDSRDRATPLPVGGEAVFTLDPAGDVDWFRLPVATAEDAVVLELTDAGLEDWPIPLRTLDFQVFDPAGEPLVRIQGSTLKQPHGGTALPVIRPAGAGDHLLRVTGTDTGGAALRLRRHGADAETATGDRSMVVMGVELDDDAAAVMRSLAADQGGRYLEAETAEAIDATFEAAVELAVDEPPAAEATDGAEPDPQPEAADDAAGQSMPLLLILAIIVALALIAAVALSRRRDRDDPPQA